MHPLNIQMGFPSRSKIRETPNVIVGTSLLQKCPVLRDGFGGGEVASGKNDDLK